jgi:lipoyl(octanoyl) transferase
MIAYLYLGRMDYETALELQREIAELRHQGRVENVLLLLEHPPVLTLGRNATRGNILATDALLASRGVAVHAINRGGDVTYHGPGQLVGYPIVDLRSLTNSTGGRLGPVDYVRRVEEALIRLCANYGVITQRIPGKTGVWTATPAGREKKIGAIGVHVSRGITSHGFAFNITTDLRDFQWIVPCGIADREVTSLEREMPNNVPVPALQEAAHAAARQFGHVFGEQVIALESLDALRRGTRAIGVPMQTPAEVERLGKQFAEPDARPVSG